MIGVREREIDPNVKNHDELRATFRWHVPDRFNIAHDTCDRHAGNPEAATRDHADRAHQPAHDDHLRTHLISAVRLPALVL